MSYNTLREYRLRSFSGPNVQLRTSLFRSPRNRFRSSSFLHPTPLFPRCARYRKNTSHGRTKFSGEVKTTSSGLQSRYRRWSAVVNPSHSKLSSSPTPSDSYFSFARGKFPRAFPGGKIHANYADQWLIGCEGWKPRCLSRGRYFNRFRLKQAGMTMTLSNAIVDRTGFLSGSQLGAVGVGYFLFH